MKMTASDVAKAREGRRLEDTADLLAALTQRDFTRLVTILGNHPQLDGYRNNGLRSPFMSFGGTPIALANQLLARSASVGPNLALAELEQAAVRRIVQFDHCAVVCGVRAAEKLAITPEVCVVPTKLMELSGDLPVERIQNSETVYAPDYGTFSGRTCVVTWRDWVELKETTQPARSAVNVLKRLQAIASLVGLATGSGAIVAAHWSTTKNSAPLMYTGGGSWTGHPGADYGDGCATLTSDDAPRAAEFLALLPQLDEWNLFKPISWFALAAQLRYIQPEQAIAYVAMAYEGLIAPGKGSVTLRFKQRGAYLMSDEPVARAEWFEFFGDLYDYRSTIVHGAVVDDHKKLNEVLYRAVQDYPDCVARLVRAGNASDADWHKIVLGAPITR